MRSRARWTLFALAVLAAASTIPLACNSLSRPSRPGLVEGRLPPCPGSPNCVNSEDDPEVAPLSYVGDGDAAFRRLSEYVRAQPRVSVVHSDSEYLHVVYRSALLRFPDDVEFRLDRERAVIHVRSASRFGYSDLGVNRRRVDALRESWAAR